MAKAEGTHVSERLAQIEKRSPDQARIIEQYRTVAGKFVELWAEIDQRTLCSDWRADGIGSCHVSPHLFETYLDGVVGGDIEDLWRATNQDRPDWSYTACAYHREGQGCVLGDLKSPRCLSHASGSHQREIRERLGINMPDFRTPLVEIQCGGMDLQSGDYSLHPEVNDALVEQLVRETQSLIDHVKTFPVLHPAE